ncbi:alpha-glucuronidase family glycosyl hydrolase [Microlunatus speluncae]|uniref:alpha-glucuronidase family glycosyl hydrolase n=1 Tax=Microlunatus speluncae TaxID=2594267 RepID=UPI001C2CE26D|nr:alpha-glucuronidase family glycosyl hydrolase [Microlunatus speluncae]
MTEVTRRGFVAGAGVAVAGSWLGWSGAQSAWAETGLPPDEDGSRLWLRYPEVDDAALRTTYRELFRYVVDPGDAVVLGSAAAELTDGLSGLLGQEVPLRGEVDGDGAVVVRVDEAVAGPEGFTIRRGEAGGAAAMIITGSDERGALYGAFHLLRLLQSHKAVDRVDVTDRPRNPLRLANHWDNLDRSVERGYAGNSVFHWDELPQTRPSYEVYARALASVGINGTVINNVNANAQFISPAMLAKIAPLAGVLRAWGISTYFSLNFASPMILGGLATADPFDTGVKDWWRDKITEIYDVIPDLGGFLVKADSEGQPGPISYGRTHADGANLIADAVKPHGGIVMWRAFVHDFNALEWSNKAYETFKPLDGKFADNAVVQIKNGPIDFQVREPAHPLFGALPNTNAMMELQITQEYTGQSTHLCYLVPMWQEVYGFDTHADGAGTTVSKIISGETYGRELGGVAGVMNFGDDADWTRHQLAAANTHGHGRLAWNPGLKARDIADEWTRQTYGNDSRLVTKINQLLLGSWQTYLDYTNPLGVSFLIKGDHFTPSPQTNTGWHQADAEGTGFDRTVATGNGYTGFYHRPVSTRYESVEDCPDELLLFLHHVPYGHRLRSGKTVIQHVYDSHFDGAVEVRAMRETWQGLRRRIDAKRWADTAERFDRHLEQATLWRDAIAGHYFVTSRILDERRSWVQVTPTATSAIRLVGGQENLVRLSVANASPGEAELVAGQTPRDGWTSGTAGIVLPSRGDGTLDVPVTPSLAPQVATLRPTLRAGQLTALIAEQPVITAPSGDQCLIAIDAGTANSPVLAGYRRLSPADRWADGAAYGWVGSVPQSRDRNIPDPLLRDFVNDTTARTLRFAIPAGAHTLYLLVGDVHDSFPTTVKIDGQVAAKSGFLLGGSFEWLTIEVDGGGSGRTADLELSTVPGQHWHLNGIVILS